MFERLKWLFRRQRVQHEAIRKLIRERCPDPECHTDYLEVYKAYVKRGRWARLWKQFAKRLYGDGLYANQAAKRLVERISSLEAEVARLRGANRDLRKYVRHGMAVAPCSGPCAEWQTEEKSCTCGLDSLLSGTGEGG